MANHRITCVTKTGTTHETITHIGNRANKWTKAAAIKAIEDETDTFHTLVGDERAEVVVISGSNGKYLRTKADGKLTNNLLNLPSCS